MKNSNSWCKSFLLIFATILFVVNFATAKVHWFSGRVVDNATIPSSSIVHKPDANAPEVTESSRLRGAGPTATLVDVVVSLHSDPNGDDDGSTQDSDPGSAQQDVYEKIFQHFADGVYESTEGAHKIRNVRIYTKGKYASRANIQWHAIGHPHVPYKGGVNMTGGHINMYDVFKDGAGAGVNYNLLDHPDGAGYTCAHEWGHYYYGLYDEYSLQAGDVPVKSAIMNSQWNAMGGNYGWLNFSTPWISGPPFADYENTKKTKQHRVFAKSAWETLDSNTASDDANKMSLGSRTYYAELSAVAPAGANTPAIQLPGTARSDLNIIWMGDANMVYQIVIDHSGSMGWEAGKMENAKTAAKYLVDKAEVNEAKVGVIVFDDTITVLQPITLIDSQATKNAIKGLISGVSAEGGTYIGAAAQTALNGLLALGTTTDSKMVFLLTDGQDGGSVSIPSVIAAYQAAQIPIYTFAYGNDAETSTLITMANDTGGEFYSSPTTMAEITQVFDNAFQDASDSQGVGVGSQVVNRRSDTFPLVVDSTLSRLDLIVTYDGIVADADVNLYAPDGSEVATTVLPTESGGQTLYQYSIENPQAGEWELKVSSNSGHLNFSYQASGLSADQTYALSIDSSAGTSVAYPATVVLTATLEKGLPIAGADVFAQVENPDGIITPFTLNDNGVSPDSLAGDGKYTGNLVYRKDGLHKISIQMDNYSGKAALTYNGAIMSGDINGDTPPQISNEPVGEDFSRSASLQVTTSGTPTIPDSTLTINKCSIIAGKGKKVEMDSILCSGTFFNLIEESDVNSASEIVVRIYKASDPTTGYNGSIAFDPTKGKKGKYSCKYKIPKGGSGAVTAFNLDLVKQTFSFQAKDVSLGGLDCPMSVKIEIGSYIGVGEANEAIVNGSKKPVPITLMNGYENKVDAEKCSVKQGKGGKGDSLMVMGSIASELPVPTDFGGVAPYTGNCTVTWGSRTFVFNLQFHHDKYYFKNTGPLYETPKNTTAGSGEIVKAKIDFQKGQFSVQIKGALPDCSLANTGLVLFGITFDTYNATDTIEP